jgi:hypothetical protein
MTVVSRWIQAPVRAITGRNHGAPAPIWNTWRGRRAKHGVGRASRGGRGGGRGERRPRSRRRGVPKSMPTAGSRPTIGAGAAGALSLAARPRLQRIDAVTKPRRSRIPHLDRGGRGVRYRRARGSRPAPRHPAPSSARPRHGGSATKRRGLLGLGRRDAPETAASRGGRTSTIKGSCASVQHVDRAVSIRCGRCAQ